MYLWSIFVFNWHIPAKYSFYEFISSHRIWCWNIEPYCVDQKYPDITIKSQVIRGNSRFFLKRLLLEVFFPPRWFRLKRDNRIFMAEFDIWSSQVRKISNLRTTDNACIDFHWLRSHMCQIILDYLTLDCVERAKL